MGIPEWEGSVDNQWRTEGGVTSNWTVAPRPGKRGGGERVKKDRKAALMGERWGGRLEIGPGGGGKEYLVHGWNM